MKHDDQSDLMGRGANLPSGESKSITVFPTKMILTLTAEGFSFFDPNANAGVKSLALCLQAGGAEEVVRYERTASVSDGLEGEAKCGTLDIRTTVTSVPGLDAVVVVHRITNKGKEPAVITHAATGGTSGVVLHGLGNWLGWDLRYCHTDNVRTEHYPHCQMEYPYLRMLPVEPVHLGRGEDQAFPALFVKDEKSGKGVVFAAASQETNFATFKLRKAAMVNEGVFEEFAIVHDPGQNEGFTIPPGGSLVMDGVFIQVAEKVAVGDAFEDYVNFLAGRFDFCGAKSPLLREAFHCTWNYGVFADQSEASLLPTAKFISANIPNIKWFLMDAGYLAGDIDSTFLDQFYPDPNQHVIAEKWPHGIRGYTDELRRLGLRPGLWWSPTARLNSMLFADHPEWFLRNADGAPYRISEQNGFLDYSHAGALDYLDRTLAVILGEWGMDACKMDFWSQNFETRTARLHDPEVTAIQARARFLKMVRKHLPPDGIFMTCVATGMGNPFIGEWADTYRNTIDIGVGDWEEQIRNCIWALPTLGIEGRKTFLLNNDSVGIMPQHPDNENEFRFTWTFMNMGIVETGGRMETWPAKWVAAMCKLTDRCDRGYRVRCPDDRAFTGVPLPEVLYVDFPADSRTSLAGVRQSVALFNWSDEPRILSISRKRLGHAGPVRAENFWTGEREILDGEFLSRRLEGRSALLYDILQDGNTAPS